MDHAAVDGANTTIYAPALSTGLGVEETFHRGAIHELAKRRGRTLEKWGVRRA